MEGMLQKRQISAKNSLRFVGCFPWVSYNSYQRNGARDSRRDPPLITVVSILVEHVTGIAASR